MTSAAFARALALRSETLPNRIAKAAMTEGLADAQGRASEGLVRLYGAWARGGAGLLITGNVLIDAHHLERPGNVVIAGAQDNDARAALRRWMRLAAAPAQGSGCSLVTPDVRRRRSSIKHRKRHPQSNSPCLANCMACLRR